MSQASPSPDSGKPQATLSLCMIVKDEEYFLRRCLSAVQHSVDEIVVVDTGSTDQTRALAAEFTDKVFDFKWDDDFSHARNFSLGKAAGDWILVLDADELITEADLQRIRQTIADTDQDAFFLIQYNYNDDPLAKDWLPVREKTAYSADYKGYRRNPIARLFRNNRGICYSGRVHEVIDLSLEGMRHRELEVPIHHHMDDNPTRPKKDRQFNYLRIMEQALAGGSDNGRLYASAAGVHMYYTNDLHKALEYFQRAVDLGYDRDQSLEGVAEAHYRLQQFPESYSLYVQLFQAGRRSYSLCTNLANLLVKRGDFSNAVKLLRMSLTFGALDDESIGRIEHNIRYLESQPDRS